MGSGSATTLAVLKDKVTFFTYLLGSGSATALAVLKDKVTFFTHLLGSGSATVLSVLQDKVTFCTHLLGSGSATALSVLQDAAAKFMHLFRTGPATTLSVLKDAVTKCTHLFGTGLATLLSVLKDAFTKLFGTGPEPPVDEPTTFSVLKDKVANLTRYLTHLLVTGPEPAVDEPTKLSVLKDMVTNLMHYLTHLFVTRPEPEEDEPTTYSVLKDQVTNFTHSLRSGSEPAPEEVMTHPVPAAHESTPVISLWFYAKVFTGIVFLLIIVYAMYVLWWNPLPRSADSTDVEDPEQGNDDDADELPGLAETRTASTGDESNELGGLEESRARSTGDVGVSLIQKIVRGRQSRQKFNAIKVASVTVQGFIRKKFAERRVCYERYQATMKIQCAWRVFTSRQQLARRTAAMVIRRDAAVGVAANNNETSFVRDTTLAASQKSNTRLRIAIAIVVLIVVGSSVLGLIRPAPRRQNHSGNRLDDNVTVTYPLSPMQKSSWQQQGLQGLQGQAGGGICPAMYFPATSRSAADNGMGSTGNEIRSETDGRQDNICTVDDDDDDDVDNDGNGLSDDNNGVADQDASIPPALQGQDNGVLLPGDDKPAETQPYELGAPKGHGPSGVPLAIRLQQQRQQQQEQEKEQEQEQEQDNGGIFFVNDEPAETQSYGWGEIAVCGFFTVVVGVVSWMIFLRRGENENNGNGNDIDDNIMDDAADFNNNWMKGKEGNINRDGNNDPFSDDWLRDNAANELGGSETTTSKKKKGWLSFMNLSSQKKPKK